MTPGVMHMSGVCLPTMRLLELPANQKLREGSPSLSPALGYTRCFSLRSWHMEEGGEYETSHSICLI